MAKTTKTPTYVAFENDDSLLERVLKAQNNIVHITQNYWALESSNIGSGTAPIYYNSSTGNFATISSLGVALSKKFTISVNGASYSFNNSSDTNAGTIYAPTSVGSANSYLKSSGSGVPTWQSPITASSGITSGSTTLATAGAIYDYVQTAISGSSKYLGVVSALDGLATSNVDYGDFYRADSQFTLPAGTSSDSAITIHSSDLLICKVNTGSPARTTAGWDVVHSGDNTYRPIGNATISGSTIAIESTPTITETNLLPLYVYGDNGITAKVSSGSSYNTLAITASNYKYSVNGTSYTFNPSTTFNLVAGTNITITAGTASGGITPFTITAKDTTYSMATSSVLGLVKLASDTTQSVAMNSITTTASRTYGIQKNSSNQLVVNVPWTDTKNTVGATSSNSSLYLVGTTTNSGTPVSYTSSVKVQGSVITGTLKGSLQGTSETKDIDSVFELLENGLDKTYDDSITDEQIQFTSATITQKVSYYTSSASQNYWQIIAQIPNTDTTNFTKILNYVKQTANVARPLKINYPLASSGSITMEGNATTIYRGDDAKISISMMLDDVQSVRITAQSGVSGEVRIITTEQPATISSSNILRVFLPIL